MPTGHATDLRKLPAVCSSPCLCLRDFLAPLSATVAAANPVLVFLCSPCLKPYMSPPERHAHTPEPGLFPPAAATPNTRAVTLPPPPPRRPPPPAPPCAVLGLGVASSEARISPSFLGLNGAACGVGRGWGEMPSMGHGPRASRRPSPARPRRLSCTRSLRPARRRTLAGMSCRLPSLGRLGSGWVFSLRSCDTNRRAA